jgi:hypothetical protein
MMFCTNHDGILFIEGECPGCQLLRPVEVKIQGMFSQAQLKSLDDVKDRMAQEARHARGNAIVRFKYGQRTTFWTTLLSLDDVGWYGTGVIGRLSDSHYQRILLENT